ncbi:MAG: hypothetical protein ACRDFB_04485 [Rhabdochlamydiaceae bacterium]
MNGFDKPTLEYIMNKPAKKNKEKLVTVKQYHVTSSEIEVGARASYNI